MPTAKFDINPHVIRQLGAELVSDPVTALMELIKNSYDADASYVSVVIDTEHEAPDSDLFYKGNDGYISIDDDGFGMNEEVIMKSWFIISYSNKRNASGVKIKTDKGRTPLGDKGLGRLSTQRLAGVCEIYTKKKDEVAVHAGFRWRDFDSAEKLQDVSASIESCNVNKSHGTRLVLTDLMEKKVWQGAELERFKALICQLISPYAEERPFNVFLKVNGEVIDIDAESDRLTKSSVCDYHFDYANQVLKWNAVISMRKLLGSDSLDVFRKFLQNDSGEHFLESFLRNQKSDGFRKGEEGAWLYLSQEFTLRDAVGSIHGEMPADPGPFKGRIQEFSFSNKLDEKGWNELYTSFQDYKSFVQAQQGIKVYRNGFAVRPYGINGNDWLNLGSAQTSGPSFYGLRPRNVVGYVAIDEGENNHLNDKTDREGFVDNEYSSSFVKLLGYLIDRINEKMELLRRYYVAYKKQIAPENKRVNSLTEAYAAIKENSEESEELAQRYNVITKRIDAIQSIVKDTSKDVLSLSDKNEQSEKIRTIITATEEMLEEAKSLLSDAQRFSNDAKVLEEALNVIKPQIESLENQLMDFTELASLGLVSEMTSHDLGQIANRLMECANTLELQLKSKDADFKQTRNAVTFIKSSVSSIRKQIKHLDSSMKYRREKLETFSVSEMIREEEFSFYQQKLEQLGIEIELNAESDFMVTMNRGRLVQILDNLINNSIYWLEEFNDKIEGKPTITITVRNPWIYYEDNGLGIDPNVESTLFDPFVTRKPVGEGRGLGLFIVTQLLNDIGCSISLDDIRNDKGRLYRFVINMFERIDK